MYTEGLEQLMKSSKNFSNPFIEWNHLTTELYKHVAEENLEIMGEHFSRLSDQLKRLSHTKKPEDFFNIMKDCINEDITATVENSQKILHSSIAQMEECMKLCGTSFAYTHEHVPEETKSHGRDKEGSKR